MTPHFSPSPWTIVPRQHPDFRTDYAIVSGERPGILAIGVVQTLDDARLMVAAAELYWTLREAVAANANHFEESCPEGCWVKRAQKVLHQVEGQHWKARKDIDGAAYLEERGTNDGH